MRVENEDFLVTFSLDPNGCMVEFEAWEVVGGGFDGETALFRPADDEQGFTEYHAKARRYAHGRVKWDGCSDWYFDEQEHVMLHFCGRRNARSLSRLVETVYDTARSMMLKAGSNIDDDLFE